MNGIELTPDGIELTPALLALVPLVAAIIQMAKKFPALSKFGDYFPVLAMALGFGGTFAIGEPASIGQKIIAGIVIGLTASGGYEALKGRGTTVATILLLCLLPLCVCGCSGIMADARHAALIDTTAATAASISDRAAKADSCDTCVGDWTRDEVKTLLKHNADLWMYFSQAKNGQGTYPAEGLVTK